MFRLAAKRMFLRPARAALATGGNGSAAAGGNATGAADDYSDVPEDPAAFTIEVLAVSDPEAFARLVRAMFVSPRHRALAEGSLDPAAVVIVKACSLGLAPVAVAMYERMAAGLRGCFFFFFFFFFFCTYPQVIKIFE
jgi:hypothetical protein